ncbi:ParB/Srx family N-terminal domain-containing protein [Fulvivirgaceae bacterium BMA12]|uniref:ParB/Srx family N-terminal domain-containing protein n=1 Tax=Agaribacillus aureus TaxID=3051825 RepID=A0ABT8LGS9_9BACT|nr:ParB/Srx family N-terminal domain-containing protein [Fulvivirgaceae bacterium BMA12]
MSKIFISEELKEYIVALDEGEFKQLETNLLEEGCRDPLIVWKKKDGSQWLVDGHNRLQICQKHNLPYKVELRTFKNIREVRMWMINNQLGRRNLNAFQISYYRGLKYESLKKSWGGKEYTQASYQKGISNTKDKKTSDLLAEEFKVGRMTIHRDAKFAKGLDLIGKKNPALKNSILAGKTKIKKSSILLFSDIDENTFKTIKNEADLSNKANILKKLTDGSESELDDEKLKKINLARQELNERDQLFEDRNERIQRTKGMILSAINQAIEKKNDQSLNELKSLITKLENLLLPDT